jgi:predicted N-acetyltransferase YhbS
VERITTPEPLTEDHDCNDFDCGRASLNIWLRKTALKNEANDASRTFVICQAGKVVGYYCLATGSVTRAEAPGKIKRRMPEPPPIIILGRLAVDKNWQGQGIGIALLRNALLRCLEVAKEVAVKAVLVHALDEEAKHFYESVGFVGSPANQLTLCMSMLDIDKINNP